MRVDSCPAIRAATSRGRRPARRAFATPTGVAAVTAPASSAPESLAVCRIVLLETPIAGTTTAGVEGRHRPLRPGGARQRIDRGRSQHHRDDARGRLEDGPHGRALQRRRISRARRGCQVPLRAHPPTRPRLGFDAIDQAPRFPRRDRHRVRASWSNGDGPRAA